MSPSKASNCKRTTVNPLKEGIWSASEASRVACKTCPPEVLTAPAVALSTESATRSTGTMGHGCAEERKTRRPRPAMSAAPAVTVDGPLPFHPAWGAAHAGPTIDGRTIRTSSLSAEHNRDTRCSVMAFENVYVFGKPNSRMAFAAHFPCLTASKYNSIGSKSRSSTRPSGKKLVDEGAACTKAVETKMKRRASQRTACSAICNVPEAKEIAACCSG
mmetsp:Transcript_59061/g.116979  ORF Transcript_59061/g.116979 Transcript_59061/m.116979 type:complete len:217 (+) Transcript_59061:1309-1959(+)